jgi:myo-inositol-1(or 4)-monophosphatase
VADLLGAIVQVAREAGEMALARWRTDVPRSDKADGSPVCEVDLDVDAMLRARLLALTPDAGWLSEETADRPDRLARPQVWVVDPIDGTRDYLRGRPGWAISVALVEAGRVVLAVLDAPARDERWHAAAGEGAWRNGIRIQAGDRTALPGARVPTDALPKADRDLVAVAKPNSIALRVAMVAADEADLVTTLRWGNEWDIAAAALLASEAGATVTDALGRPLSFNKPDPQAFGMIVSAPGIHAAAVERLDARARSVLA